MKKNPSTHTAIKLTSGLKAGQSCLGNRGATDTCQIQKSYRMANFDANNEAEFNACMNSC